MTKDSSYKGERFSGAGLHGGKRGSTQADLVLEEPRVLLFDLKAARGSSLLRWAEPQCRNLKAHPYSNSLSPTSPHLLQKAPSANSTISYGPSLFKPPHRLF